MKTHISFQAHAEHLQVVLHGAFPSTTFRELLLSIRNEADRSGHTRILVDAFGLPAPDSDLYRFWIGEAVADIFKSDYRFAVACRPEFINKFVENVAVNRGSQVLVVGDEHEALHWLMS